MELKGWFAVGALFAALLIGIIFGTALSDRPIYMLSEHPNILVAWLYKWSTLITGLLAVLAALITVIEMRRIDLQQGSRHNELMKLSLRGERLRLRRAAEWSEYLSDHVQDSPNRWRDTKQETSSTNEALFTIKKRAEVWINFVEEHLTNDCITDALPLFDATTMRFYGQAVQAIAHLKALLGQATASEVSEDQLGQSIGVWIDELWLQGEEFIESLQSLSDRYQ